MMHCQQCGAEVAEGAAFCQKCGANLAAAPGNAGQSPLSPAASRGEVADVPEAALWEGSFSGKSLIGTWIVCALLTLAIIVGGLVLALLPPAWMAAVAAIVVVWLYPVSVLAYQRLSVRYRLTNQRLFHERGILRRITDRIEVIDIDDVTFEQGIIERMLGVGTIRISSSDRTHGELTMKGIDDVARVASLIDDARRAERRRRGLYIESV